MHFGDEQVFENATTYTCLLFLTGLARKTFDVARVTDLSLWRTRQDAARGEVPAEQATANEWNFAVGASADLFEKVASAGPRLGTLASMFVGLQTSADTVFLFKDARLGSAQTVRLRSKALDDEIEIERELLKPVIRSGSIGRYWAEATAFVLFPYETESGHAVLLPETVLRQRFPKAWKYLLANRRLLEEREHRKFADSGW